MGSLHCVDRVFLARLLSGNNKFPGCLLKNLYWQRSQAFHAISRIEVALVGPQTTPVGMETAAEWVDSVSCSSPSG